jgi:hypothetical protein
MQYVRPQREVQYSAIFQTMVAVVTLEGTEPMVPLERLSVAAIARHIFDREIDVDYYEPEVPADLELTIQDPDLRLFVVRMLMTLPLVAGTVSKPRVDLVERIAIRLDSQREEFSLLRQAVKRRWNWFIRRIVLHGVQEYWNTNGKATLHDWFEMICELFIPGVFRKPEVTARYAKLRQMPPSTLGGALAQYYTEKKFPLPGEKGGTNEKFALHDYYHIFSGYPPEPEIVVYAGSVRGEMLVSVFTGGNKVYESMDWVIVPILNWHCGAPVISPWRKYARRNLLHPDAYFHALRRGMEMNVNLMDQWNWWDHLHENVEQTRQAYHVLPLEPLLDGTHEPPEELFDVDRASLRPVRKRERAKAGIVMQAAE